MCVGALLVGVIEAEEAERARATARERSAVLAQMSRQAAPAELCICTQRSQPVFGGVCVHVPQVHPPTSVAPGDTGGVPQPANGSQLTVGAQGGRGCGSHLKHCSSGQRSSACGGAPQRMHGLAWPRARV